MTIWRSTSCPNSRGTADQVRFCRHPRAGARQNRRRLSARKSDDFIADVERQFEWYAVNADWDIAELYLAAVENACQLLAQHPLLGPVAEFSHPRLRGWRFIVVPRPFQKHILFYETASDDVLLRRAMHGHRDLPRRLVEPPETK